ncbi:thioesterase II family protein [Streptomyces inhibens]|uniref:thioesterase II family protein n=1 Tax=Streptomyces inhibens TaxID=2293571 RepID=UPI0037A0BD1A
MTAERNSTWTRRFRPAPDAPSHLVCFPHAGGSARWYLSTARALAPAVDVLAVQYPGRQDRLREAPIGDAHALADRITEELRAGCDRPVTLFGHSLGATLAFEVALRLERAGIAPLGLIVSGRRAPSRHRPGQFHTLDDGELIAATEQLGGMDTRLLNEPEILRLVLPSLRSDYRAAETYRWRPDTALRCPVLAMTGDHDPQAPTEDVRAWSAHTSGAFTLKTFTGGHFYVNDHLEAVHRAIMAFIDSRAPSRIVRDA